ncbi:MAG TPA: O-methyltransferase [Candidatus Nitrosotenuis sp.]|nr:O-methyltransferase [Candidatus Nitrosotenuis sp.]
MQNKISVVLRNLEKRSQLEKSRKINVNKDQRMLAITKETGMFFHKLLVSIKARQVLELGTSVGYSTLWFADALAQNHKKSKIITIEQNSQKVKRAMKNFERAGVAKMIRIKHGKILDVLKSMPKNPRFDFVLIDADKENAKKYFDLVLPMTKIGGIIATDNMLYPEKYRKIMYKYSRYIAKKSNVRTATLPFGNGEEITIRIK